MKTLVSFLSEPVAVALGWTLLHALWQGFALVMPAALLMHLFRQKSSQLRYNVGVGTLLAQVAISLATFYLYYQPVLHTIRSSAKAVLTPVVATPALWPMVSRSLPWHLQAQRFLETHLTEIVVCWLIGVAVFLVRLAGGWLYVQRLKTTAVQPADAFWQSAKSRLCTQLGVRQSVLVLESMQVLVPMVVGALKPVILLPIGLTTGLSMQEAEAILAHELAHVKRFDYGVNLLQSVVEVVYFFHPALWWLSARVREERENCCDDLAVQVCGNARSLAQALARVEEFSQTPVLAMALASQKRLLLNRVRRMLGVSARPVVSNGHLLVLTLATLLLATVSVYAIQQEPQPKPRKAQSLPTRAHKTPNGTEFGITDNHKVDYVIWGGHKLPAKRVASLQSQLDRVKAGQLSLDDVPQDDRDILLAIIETNQSLDTGMKGLAQGLGHINADNITVASLDGLSASMDTKLAQFQDEAYKALAQKEIYINAESQLKLAELESMHASKAADDALAALGQAKPALDVLKHLAGNTDSLQAVREQNRSKAAVIRLQMEKQRFAVDAIRRKMEVVSYDKIRVEQQRLQATMKQRQILMKSRTTQADADREAAAKQIAETEQAIQQQEAVIEKNAQQLIDLQKQLDDAQKPIREAEVQLRKLGMSGYETYSIGPQNVMVAVDAADFEGPEMPDMPDIPKIPEAPEVYVNGYTNTYRSPRAAITGRTTRGTIAPKIGTPARPARPTTAPSLPGRAAMPPSPAVAPLPTTRTSKSARPAATPKPATAPAPKSTDN